MVKSNGDIDIKIEEFKISKINEESMWMPVVVDKESSNGSIFLLFGLFNGNDETFSLACTEIKANSTEATPSKFRADFQIRPTLRNKVAHFTVFH